MGMIVQHNMSSYNANRNLGITAGNLSKTTEKLSSGYKINRAGDNAAGLAISEKMRGQIRGLNQGSSNSQDGISLIQTAEGALTETHSILQRMRELAVQATNDTNTEDDRAQIQNEIDQLTSEVDRIAGTTEYNSKKLLDGSRTGSVSEKSGKANVEGNFANSNVSASITTNGSAKEAYTDIIRVEITEDFVVGKSTKDTQKYSNTDLYSTAVVANGVGSAYMLIHAKANIAAGPTKEVALDQALKEAKTGTNGLKSKQDALVLNQDAITENATDVLSTTVANLFAKNTTILGDVANTGKESLFAAGATEEKLVSAVKKLVDAYTATGIDATNAAIAGGANDTAEIKAAKAELASLFNSGSTAALTAATGGAVFTLEQVKDDTNTGGAALATSVAANIGALVTDVVGKITTAAQQMSRTQTDAVANKGLVDEQQKVVNLLENKDLALAAYDYQKAKLARDAAVGAGSVAEKEKQQSFMDAAMDKINTLNADKKVISITDLFGNSSDSKKFEIAENVAGDGSLNITMKNGDNEDTVVTIKNADKLKAGDVITLTSEKYTESKQAATGEDALRLQVGANAGQEVAMGINSMKAKDLNLVQTKDGSEGKALEVKTQAGASMAINAYDLAIQKVSTERAKMGAVQNRLEHTISNLDTSAENLQSAESRIRDTDMASEMTQHSKNNILVQAGQSMLAQANQSTQGVLSLLQ